MDLGAEAARLGIEADYVDARGRRQVVPPAVLQQLVEALGPGAAQAGAAGREVAPRSVRPAFQGPAGRWWALGVQLYGIRSERNWGHGDFSDLLALIELAGRMGAAGIGVNPLHALFDDRPGEPSPYSPNSRLFLNPLYVDVEANADFDAADAAGLTADIERCRRAELVDYPAVAAAKQRCLRAAYRRFRQAAPPARRELFAAFKQARNPALARFASFEILRRRLAGPWWEWPAKWRNPSAAALQALRHEADEDIGYVEYVQWIADQQLMRCRDRARELGLPIGLYLDVAVGVQAAGFDAWSEPRAIMRSLAVGAPPDPLNTAGQNWGIAGFSGVGLQGRRFQPFRDMLRAAMRYAGAIRLDHVLGLKRLYLIPDGMPAHHGAYVRLPFERMLKITADESIKHHCIVIGEDLGTVPEHFREQLARWGIWSYQVMLFERGQEGAFQPPEHYSERALVTFSTHDMATFAGWARGRDLAAKLAIGIDPGETDDERDAAIAALRRATARQDIEGDIEGSGFPAVLAYLARTPAKLLVVGLEDVLGMSDQFNIPGTTHEHPNWRRKYPVELESLQDAAALKAVARNAAEHGRGPHMGAHLR
jgi:4-alpha-glucanotransferase